MVAELLNEDGLVCLLNDTDITKQSLTEDYLCRVPLEIHLNKYQNELY